MTIKTSLALVCFVLFAAAFFVSFFTGTSPASIDAVRVDPSPPAYEVSGDYQDTFNPAPNMSPANGYLARIMLNSPEELEKALLRAEELYHSGEVSEADNPLAFVLHGPEIQIFFKENYTRYKSIVDLAAKLSAFEVVDVKVCETRLATFGESSDELPPFVETVPFGPAEVDRLVVEEQYVYF